MIFVRTSTVKHNLDDTAKCDKCGVQDDPHIMEEITDENGKIIGVCPDCWDNPNDLVPRGIPKVVTSCEHCLQNVNNHKSGCPEAR
jgi:hypothetical protein